MDTKKIALTARERGLLVGAVIGWIMENAATAPEELMAEAVGLQKKLLPEVKNWAK